MRELRQEVQTLLDLLLVGVLLFLIHAFWQKEQLLSRYTLILRWVLCVDLRSLVNVPPEVFKQGLLQVVLVLLSEDCLLKKLLQSDVWVIFLFLAVQSQLDCPLLFVLDDRPDDDVE